MVPIRAHIAGPKCVAVEAKGMDGKWNTLYFKCDPKKFSEGVIAYRMGAFVQDAFPFLTANEREFLISGITPAQWKAIFGSSPHEE